MSDELPEVSSVRGESFGRFVLVHELATGGMATLYLARVSGPSGFEKFVALKRIHPHLAKEQQFVDMFLDEARIAARINHPNVVQIYELGLVDKDLFMAMEYVEGESLGRLMNHVWKRREPEGSKLRFPLAEAAYLITETAAGLHAAHELTASDGKRLELVHRDISPHNILVTYGGHVKLIDFGVAKARGRISQTSGGTVKGKIAYMSPEQLLGHPVDRRSDIFSLGIVLFELTCGRRVFKIAAEQGALSQITEVKIRRPTELRPGYPPELEAVVMRALARRPEDRFQTAEELRRELQQVALSLGPPRGAPDVAALMHSHFEERMAQRARLRDSVDRSESFDDKTLRLESSDTLELDAATPSAETVAATQTAEQGSARPHRKWAVGGALAAAAAALGLVLYFAGVGRSEPAAAPLGSIRVSSSPPNAEVFRDGEGPVARTPARLAGLTPGEHTIALRLEGYVPWSKTLHIEETGQEILLDASLARQPPVQEVEPAAEASSATTAHESGSEEAAPEPAPKTKKRRERASSSQRPAAEPGLLTIDTFPWAEVWLGSRKLGLTPLIDVELPAGKHTLTLRPKGEKPGLRYRVEIKPGERTRKQVDLKRLR